MRLVSFSINIPFNGIHLISIYVVALGSLVITTSLLLLKSPAYNVCSLDSTTMKLRDRLPSRRSRGSEIESLFLLAIEADSYYSFSLIFFNFFFILGVKSVVS